MQIKVYSLKESTAFCDWGKKFNFVIGFNGWLLT